MGRRVSAETDFAPRRGRLIIRFSNYITLSPPPFRARFRARRTRRSCLHNRFICTRQDTRLASCEYQNRGRKAAKGTMAADTRYRFR